MMSKEELDQHRTPETGAASADCLQRVVRRIPASAREIALEAYKDLMAQPMPSPGDTLGFRRTIMLAVLIGRTIEADESDSPNAKSDS